MMMKRGKVDKESLQMLGSNEFPISMAPGLSSISEEFIHSIILRPKKPLGSWNLVNPLFSINEAWMDVCRRATRGGGPGGPGPPLT